MSAFDDLMEPEPTGEMARNPNCTHLLGQCKHCRNCTVCEYHEPKCPEYTNSPAAAALKKAFPGAILWPDCDDTNVTAAFGRVAGTQLFRFQLRRPGALDEDDQPKRPKKPWPDVWQPTLYLGSGYGFSPGRGDEKLTLAESVAWLRQKVDEVIWSLGRSSR